jgi:hypothetical protein
MSVLQKWISDSTLKQWIRDSVHMSFSAHELRQRIKNPNSELVYPNQKEAAVEIQELFLEGAVAVTLLALPQVGKTGVMLYIAYLMATFNDDDFMIDPENIFIISGMNDIDWYNQTKENLPDSLNQKVYTRSKFSSLESLDSLRNALIIIDECHIAAEARNQMCKTLTKAKLDTPENLRRKNVKILQVSATPAHTLFNAVNKWGVDNHGVVRLKASPKYIGFQQLLDSERIMDTHEFGVDMITEIEGLIKAEYPTPKYHIFRVNRNQRPALDAMILKNKENGWISKEHNSDSREDTDILFETPPVQHTFIIIKNFWRAGKRLNDTNVGIVYEEPASTPDLNVVAQSLAGRLCGNDKQTPASGSPIIYCHKQSIVNYVNWFNSDGDFKKLVYNSRVLKSDGEGFLYVKPSLFSDKGVSARIAKYAIHSETFDNGELAKAWANENLNYRSAFYELYDETGEKEGTTYIKYRGKLRPIWIEEQVRAYTDNGWGTKDSARIMPVMTECGASIKELARVAPVLAGTDKVIKYIVIYKLDGLK